MNRVNFSTQKFLIYHLFGLLERPGEGPQSRSPATQNNASSGIIKHKVQAHCSQEMFTVQLFEQAPLQSTFLFCPSQYLLLSGVNIYKIF
jgi:hypothetical protein